MRESILNQFRLTALEKGLGVYGINIYQKGQEELSYQWRSSDKVCLYSGSKTFTSVAIGICQDEGLLKISDTALSFFPEYKNMASEHSDTITIRDLLHMSSGKKVFYFSTDDEEKIMTNDWVKLFFSDPMKGEAGAEFFYSNTCTYMLSRIVEKVSGLKLRDFLVPRLFSPLGILNPQWHTCPDGHTLGATGLYLCTNEFSKLGLVFLNDGIYKDNRIVSEEYIKNCVTDVISNADYSSDSECINGYGYQLWSCSYKGAYRADGLYGQFCIVFPDKEAVITVTSHEENNANNISRAIYKDIVPYLD